MKTEDSSRDISRGKYVLICFRFYSRKYVNACYGKVWGDWVKYKERKEEKGEEEELSESEVAQSCPTLCDPMDCSPPNSSVHGVFQARTLEWVAISFSRGSSRPRDWTRVSRIAGRHFTIWATREAGNY